MAVGRTLPCLRNSAYDIILKKINYSLKYSTTRRRRTDFNNKCDAYSPMNSMNSINLQILLALFIKYSFFSESAKINTRELKFIVYSSNLMLIRIELVKEVL